jgi:phosphate transport system substrate-binding protein
MNFRRFVGVGLLVMAVAPFGVMAQEATPAVEPIELPAVDPLSVMGDITIAGSSTVYPLTERIAELFTDEGYSGVITIDSIGTGGGFERFCEAAETDIANASRPIRDGEAEACVASGRPAIEFRVGTDALAVVVSAENDFVESLTIEQLGRIYAGEYTTWDQVDASYPAEAIQLFSPGSDSGTFGYFAEEVVASLFEGDDADALAEAAILNAPGVQLSEDDNVLVQGVEGSPYAIGYFGFAYYSENAEGLRALAIDGGDGAVTPDFETAEDGTYPLARPLFIYSAAEVLAEKPQVADFIAFYLTNVDSVIQDVGYFPASVNAENVAKQNWLDAVGE